MTDNTRYYDAFSSTYDEGRDRGYHKLIDDQAAAIVRRVGEGRTALEVGCGTGLVMQRVAGFAAHVSGIDVSPGMLVHARARGLDVHEGSATTLPFPDASFDVALSTFGVMFAPDHARTAREMLRVVRPGGRIGLANWTPDGFIGRLFKVIASHVPPPAGVKPPPLWGTLAHLSELFNVAPGQIRSERKHFNFRYRSAAHFIQVFREFYGPTHKAFLALDAARQDALQRDLEALIEGMNVAGPSSLVVPSEYLEAVITTAR
jgi:ubiquinone/menaquinone biosynthesis C-methylase UbiE